MTRKSISKKIRFEVFKRDSFTCQYCGQKAPDVVLHIDHMKPVVEGGTNEIVNLITACFDCNSGKGKREISDSSVVKKQQKQLEALNERRIQLEMMSDWRTGLSSIDNDILEEAYSALEQTYDINITEKGKLSVKKWVKQFSVKEIAEAAKESFSQYIRYDEDDRVTQESREKAFNKIGRIAHYRKNGGMSEELKQGFYIAAVLANRGLIREWEKKEVAMKIEKVFSIKHYAPTFESAKNLAKNCESITEFCELVVDFISKHADAEPAAT